VNCPASVPQQDFWIKFGAGEGIRTLDFNLGKVARYHGEAPFLNESLSFFTQKLNANCPATVPRKKRFSHA